MFRKANGLKPNVKDCYNQFKTGVSRIWKLIVSTVYPPEYYPRRFERTEFYGERVP